MPVRGEKMKESRVNPCQYSKLLEATGEDGKERGRIGRAESLTFIPYMFCGVVFPLIL